MVRVNESCCILRVIHAEDVKYEATKKHLSVTFSAKNCMETCAALGWRENSNPQVKHWESAPYRVHIATS